MDAGRILSDARRRAGLTQTELAGLAGVPQVTVSRIERRTRVPRVDTLDRLLEACGAGLILTRRLGLEVDREPIRQVLALSLQQRLRGGSLRILAMLAVRRMRFVVIGMTAERLQGVPAPTDEVAICAPAHHDNGQRVEDVLRQLRRWQIGYSTLRWRRMPPPPFGSYDELAKGADQVTVRGRRITVASLDDLIRIRLAARSSCHRAQAEILGAVRDEADARAPRPARR
jgi:transcriptional regulator with XRE-family HTH domain